MRPIDVYGSGYHQVLGFVIQRREFLGQLSDCQLLRKNFFPPRIMWHNVGCTNLPKLHKPPQNSRRQRDDWKRIPHWGPTDFTTTARNL